MTEVIIMSADQFVEEKVVPVPNEEENPGVKPEAAESNTDNPLRARLVALQQAFVEGVSSKDPSVITQLEKEMQQLLEDPQAGKILEELLKEKLEKKDQAPQSEEQNPSKTTVEQQQDLEKQTDSNGEQSIGSGDMKIDDVITSLETYKSALEDAGETVDTELSGQEEGESSNILKTDQDTNVDNRKQAIIQNALKDLKKDPMVATLINMISPEPAVLGSFITVLGIFKGNKERKSDGQEATISTTQFLMLSFLFG